MIESIKLYIIKRLKKETACNTILKINWQNIHYIVHSMLPLYLVTLVFADSGCIGSNKQDNQHVEAFVSTDMEMRDNLPDQPAITNQANAKAAIFIQVGLWGFADLHAHPAAHLGFGATSDGAEGIFWGKPGHGYFSSTDPSSDLSVCATDKHSGFDLDYIRHITRTKVIGEIDSITGYHHLSNGWPSLEGWPNALSLSHQQMHIRWIRRAWLGGLRLMVASTVDNQTLSMLWHRHYAKGAPTPDPNFDFQSAKNQINFIKPLVQANSSWMQVVKTPAEARNAIQSDKLAVILGVEMDTLSADQIIHLARYYDVRLVTPIHLTDNDFGGAAVYEPAFNTANYFMNGRFFNVIQDLLLEFRFEPQQTYLRHEPSVLEGGSVHMWGAMLEALSYQPSYACTTQPCGGHRNRLGLRSRQLVRRLMNEGLLIDMAHMSAASMSDSLDLAEIINYPLINTHTAIRNQDESANNERTMKRSHARRAIALGGVIGLGTGFDFSTNTPIATWLADYQNALDVTENHAVALGTDINGFSAQIPESENETTYPITVASDQVNTGPSSAPLPRMTAGYRTFDFTHDGIANYGMLPDFLHTVRQQNDSEDAVATLYRSAEETIRSWERLAPASQRACNTSLGEKVLAFDINRQHGGSLFEEIHRITVGAACHACFRRRQATISHTGHGDCWLIGWTSSNNQDCRINIDVKNSAMFLKGTCRVNIYEH